MKIIYFYLLTAIILNSCSVVYDIMPVPNDDPGWVHTISTFNKGQDSLQLQVDKFIENNVTILRRYDKRGYDKGIYRKYTTFCNKDTFKFSIVFTGDDTLSRIAVDFFRLNNISFNTLHYREQKKMIKKNKNVYNVCQTCYEKIFLQPLKDYIKAK